MTRSSAGLVVALAFTICAPAASAGSRGDCGKLFPDFTCERSGRFDGFEKPIVQPYLFEDPFITTGVHPYYVWHQFPESSAFEGGEAHVASAQIRIAVTDRLAIIATKDGYMRKQPENPLLKHTKGWMNLAFGAKYAIYQDRDAGRIVSMVLRYEAPSGASDSFQGGGDGMLMPSVSAAALAGPIALQGDLGGIWALDDSQSSSFTYHLYAGVPVTPALTPFVQLSGMHWTDSGDGTRQVELSAFGQSVLGVPSLSIATVESIYGRFEGADVANLGAVGVDGLDYVTIGFGLHARLAEHLTVSAAYERPVTEHKGITRQRLTTSVSLEF